MKREIAQKTCLSVLSAIAIYALAGCTSVGKHDVERRADQVKVYGPNQLLETQYEHVRYVWMDSWRTAFWLPSASSDADAIASLQAEAARLGANGLINVSCADQSHDMWLRRRQSSILCYGHAIRVR